MEGARIEGVSGDAAVAAVEGAAAEPQVRVVAVPFPEAFAFVGSGALLVLEIVAGRLLAPTLGVSLYTWTSVIGVVLAGVSIGNWLGGKIADRWPNRAVLGLIYLAAALTTFAILGLLRTVEALELPRGAPAILQVLWLNALLFLVPSTILGMPTPVLTRLALRSVERTGRVVGRIQAAATVGAIMGTFLTGFLLISVFGTRRIVAGVAVVLLLLALLSGAPWARKRVYELAALAIVVIGVGWISSSGCTRESDYYCIIVRDAQVGRQTSSGVEPVQGRFRALYLDRLLHGVVSLDDPTVLAYGYERLYAQALDRVYQPGERLSSMLLGGGSYTFPRYLEARYRGPILVAEIDPQVTAVAHSHLGLRDSPRITIHHEDARRALREQPEGSFDLVFGDAFNDYSVPYHLATKEFNDLIASRLKPDGLYLLNVVDGVRYDFLRSELRTLRRSFPFVALLAEEGDWPTRGDRSTFVFIASKTPRSERFPAVPAAELDAFAASGHGVLLTDDRVPVDQLLAPVFEQQLKSR